MFFPPPLPWNPKLCRLLINKKCNNHIYGLILESYVDNNDRPRTSSSDKGLLQFKGLHQCTYSYYYIVGSKGEYYNIMLFVFSLKLLCIILKEKNFIMIFLFKRKKNYQETRENTDLEQECRFIPVICIWKV